MNQPVAQSTSPVHNQAGQRQLGSGSKHSILSAAWTRSAASAPAKSIFLFGRDCIFPSRPYGSPQHGAQGRLKAGRPFGGHPQGLALTGRAPCYGGRRPWGEPARQVVHGSTRASPVPTKSGPFRVASVMPRESVIAAICASKSSIGRPIRRRSATMRANSCAAALSKARMRPAKQASALATPPSPGHACACHREGSRCQGGFRPRIPQSYRARCHARAASTWPLPQRVPASSPRTARWYRARSSRPTRISVARARVGVASTPTRCRLSVRRWHGSRRRDCLAPASGASPPRALLKISFASASTERPCAAARAASRCASVSSMLLMVTVVMAGLLMTCNVSAGGTWAMRRRLNLQIRFAWLVQAGQRSAEMGHR